MKKWFITILSLTLTACTSTKIEFDPVTGNATKLKTSANIGLATSTIREGNSQTGGVPLLSGGYQNDLLFEARENEQGFAGIEVGNVKITGTLDHSTKSDVSGHWLWRSARTIATAAVFWKGINAWETDKLAKRSAEVESQAIQAGTAEAGIAAGVRESEIAAEVERVKILNQ